MEEKEVDIDGVFDKPGENGIFMCLREINSQRVCLVSLDNASADSISLRLYLTPYPRPVPHDLIVSILNRLNASVEKVVIEKKISQTYHARIYFKAGENIMNIDSRPGDAVAIALRANCRIFVADDLLEIRKDYEERVKRLNMVIAGNKKIPQA